MDTVLGLIEFVAYILAILAFSALITVVVIKVSPTKTAKPEEEAAE